MGRPTSYSREIAEEIAARVAEGASLKGISEQDGLPALRTMVRWTAEHLEFQRMLALARLEKADVLFEESIEIADEKVTDMTQATRNRLRVQARQWAAARLHPARYAEKIGLGQAPELPPLQAQASRYDSARRFLFALSLATNIMEQGRPSQGEAVAPLRLPPPAAPVER